MKNRFADYRTIGRGAATMLAMLALVLTLSSMSATAAPSARGTEGKTTTRPTDTVQHFQDVPVGSFYYDATAALYTQGVVSGYTCGTPPAGPCVPPGNLPYYVPSNTVARGQMAFYVDHARTKPLIAISDAGIVGASYDISMTNSTPAADTLHIIANGSLNYGINVTSNNSDAMDAYGTDWGLYVRNSGGNPAVDASTSGASSYGGSFVSTAYRALYAKSNTTTYYNLYVDHVGSTVGSYLGGDVYIEGNLTVTGSKTGYVVDIMKNVSGQTLEPGDVVAIAGASSDAVIGQIPVPSVKLADQANDSGVVGIVDQPLYMPDAATHAAYAAQQQADRDAAAAAAAQTPDQSKSKQKLSSMANIKNRIPDAVGMPHADSSATSVAAGGYANVVTLGAYKAVKVDASFGAIHPGDLLTTSPHAGYAMVVKDKAAASGAVIGKALSGLDSGTGTVTVMVTLK